jgi:hypothetical protein
MSATGAKLIKGATGDWEMVIGLEAHVLAAQPGTP